MDALPKIKCSDCHAEVELVALGDHVCSKAAGPTVTTSPVEEKLSVAEFNEHGPPPKRSLSRESLFNRLGRVQPPPRIDPTAANRPFLSPGAQMSPHTGSFGALTPRSASPLSPLQQLQRSHTSPVASQSSVVAVVPEGKANLDCAFPPFPRGVTSPSPSDGSYMSPSTDGRSSRATTINRHRREASIDSKAFQRLSMTSSKNGHGLPSPVSPRGSSRSRHEDRDIPPLPSGPIASLASSPVFTSGNSEPFYFGSNDNHDKSDQDQDPPETSPRDKVRQLDGMEGLDFGFTTRTKSPEMMDVDNKLEDIEEDDSERAPDSPGPSVSEYKLDREFSVSNFASGLGISDPCHAANDSTSSSNSSPSEAPSNSSFSSRPSESSNISEPKSSLSEKYNVDHLRLLQEEPPTRPKVDPFAYELDSPTDPLFQQGRLSDPPANTFPSSSETKYSTPSTQLEPAQPKKYTPYRSPTQSLNSQSSTFEQQQQQQSPSSPPLQPEVQPEPQEVREQQQQPPPVPEEESAAQPLPPSRSATPGKRRHPCRGCGEIITGKSVSSADGRLTGRYHRACFVCHTCHAPFQTADFYVLDNHPYCAADYHRLNGTLCAECGEGIEGPCLEAEDINPSNGVGISSSKKNQKFHPGCFKCRTCHIVLRGDYFEWNGSAYCERDGRRAAGLMPPPRSPGFPPPHGYQGHPPPPMGPPGPGPGPGYRRPPPPSSPLAGPRQGGRGDPRYRPMNPSSLRPRPDKHRPHPSEHQFVNSSLTPAPGLDNGPYPSTRKFPERRTTKLMMV
ncbi:TPA_exp: LIM domain protein [Trichophyton benhamiae CBS 112371]|nr:TPA_exp: LIM domain protein [Trichophyton benhamiae CBS 112371]